MSTKQATRTTSDESEIAHDVGPSSVFRPAIWWRAVRPKSFTATTTPVLVGIALAALHGAFAPSWAALTLLAALCIQAGTNLTNDYFDQRSGVDTSASGNPSNVIQHGLLAAKTVLWGGLACFMLGALLGIVLALHGGPIIWLLGVLGVLIGLLYTAGPFPLAYIGLGELVVFIAMGPAMVAGAYVVQTQRFHWTALAVGVPIGLLVAAFLHANNMRDITIDRAQGKRTLAARFGRSFARREYRLLVLGAYLALVLLPLLDWRLLLAALPALFTLPTALRLVREADSTEEFARLNAVLRGTAALHGRFGILWAIGVALLAIVAWVTR